MTKETSNVSRAEQASPVNLLTFNSSKPFDEVILEFEKQLGRFYQDRALSSPADFPEYVKRMEGSSGLMILAMLEMGVLPALVSSSTRDNTWLVIL